jgi:lipopolysaccharide transport system permease protein
VQENTENMNDAIESDNADWDLVISPRSSIFKLNLREVWNYRYLLLMFVKRDVVSVYKQTILGPLWFFIQPILTTIVFVVIFGNIAKIPTDGLPPVLFYLAGITIWNYFAEILTTTSNTFVANAGIFGKVYFPRLVLPLSKVVSGLIKFCIQFLLFLLALFFFLFKGSSVHPDFLGIVIVTPVVLFIMAGLGLGFGLILSALTTKYRDLTFLISFGIQLGMYATPVIYPLSAISSRYKWIIIANPMTSIVEAFRKVYLGNGELNLNGLLYSAIFMIILLILGTIIFNRVERTFIDIV